MYLVVGKINIDSYTAGISFVCGKRDSNVLCILCLRSLRCFCAAYGARFLRFVPQHGFVRSRGAEQGVSELLVCLSGRSDYMKWSGVTLAHLFARMVELAMVLFVFTCQT